VGDRFFALALAENPTDQDSIPGPNKLAPLTTPAKAQTAKIHGPPAEAIGNDSNPYTFEITGQSKMKCANLSCFESDNI
jgi:hypothetical protein